MCAKVSQSEVPLQKTPYQKPNRSPMPQNQIEKQEVSAMIDLTTFPQLNILHTINRCLEEHRSSIVHY